MTKIQREFSFAAGVHTDTFLMNQYMFTMYMIIGTDSFREQQVAMDRIKFFLGELLDSAILIKSSEKKSIEKYLACDFKVCTLPEQPYDQIVAIMLLLKLNAITEGRLIITDITLESTTGDGVNFIHEVDDPLGPFEENGWWSDPGVGISDEKKQRKKKIVNLFKHAPTWNDFGLYWKEKEIKLIPAETEIQYPK